ncbi:hypothetical protein MOQ_005699 [Trypanosoma cruzi marinkellei]|uniref:Uncharacterized protein n=1 Tax=Trypanosoma cruzi marinkellei TaxID=85056 RepID=K2MTR5_TRYCR|nr:hypothetical protein MOQ_005699 [Trypanosoma cruzi marinkellei]
MRQTERQCSTAPDIAPSKDCVDIRWTAQPSPDSNHCIILLHALIGDDKTPAAVPRPNRTLTWKKANWNKRGGMTNQLCRIPREQGKIGSIEKHIASGMRKSAKATVPARNRQPSPLWTPGPAELDRAIVAAPHAERSQRPKLRRRGALRRASKSCWCALRSKPEATDGNSRQAARRVYAPRPRARQPHKAVDGESGTAPKALLSATDPDECEGPRPQ